MKIVIDTNVFVSGIFFAGPPYKILESWKSGNVEFVLSREIVEEYERVGFILSEKYSEVDIFPILQLVTINTKIISVPNLPEQICVDPSDDKFLACALAGGAEIVVSGDKHLLDIKQYNGIQIISPRQFTNAYLQK